MAYHDLLSRALDYFQAGGLLMVPLAALSLVLWTLAIHKLRWFLRGKKSEVSPEQCLDLLRRSKSGKGREAGKPALWQSEILTRYLRERSGDPELNRQVLAAIRSPHEREAMRHVGTVLLLAAVAPLLGLLGTVTGMISTFDVISQFGTGNARALASGISEALVTTQTGLVVAVPGMLLGGFLLRRGQQLKSRMEIFCIRLQQIVNGGRIARAQGAKPCVLEAAS